jgi:hypothetical protein
MATPSRAISLATAFYSGQYARREGQEREMSDWVRTAPEALEAWPLRALQERHRELKEKLGHWHRYASNEAAIKASLADVEAEIERRR